MSDDSSMPSASRLKPASKPKLFKKIRTRTAAILGLLLLTVAATGFGVWYAQDPEITSPLTTLTNFTFITEITQSEGKVVYGFLPYWNLDEFAIQPELTHVSYFSLTIGADGSILTRVDGGTEPGYRTFTDEEFLALSEQLSKRHVETEVVLSQFNNDDIVAFLNSESAQDELLSSLDAILLAYPVSGVNIDIEYSGPVSDQLRENMVSFTRKTRQHLNSKYDDVQLSIDVYASAGSRYTIWDMAAIAEQVDYVIVMAYDFHRQSSALAGPVAPIFGGSEYWDSDINQHLVEMIKKVPREKILLGVPFYGYEWQTDSRESQAFTFPNSGSTASFDRVQTLLNQSEELEVIQSWNDQALSPYISYEEDGEIFVVYYEDSRSLSYKLDFVNQLNLGGIAIWAVGYEGDSRELWDVIERKL